MEIREAKAIPTNTRLSRKRKNGFCIPIGVPKIELNLPLALKPYLRIIHNLETRSHCHFVLLPFASVIVLEY